jgi:tRNA 2-thiouridine synthesizing protein B
MILHTLSALPDTPAFRDCLSALADDDALVLLGDGVYAALSGAPYLGRLLDGGARVFALGPDALAAGITNGVELIDMDDFVALTERFPRQLAWF